ncbi:MAG: peptidylprolyl isomerase [Desulfuromonas sp.]|nr:MAG: peptidylprolyl isomerase [Desulfuromonas sp.]
MSESQNQTKVKVHYTGTLADGTVFDSSREHAPLEFALGANQVIKGFEEAVSGMTVGETKTVTLPADEAYGPHHAQLVHEISASQFAEGVTPTVGMQIQSQGAEGEPPLIAMITEVTEDKVTIDANHPLAGKDLTFELELMERD